MTPVVVYLVILVGYVVWAWWFCVSRYWSPVLVAPTLARSVVYFLLFTAAYGGVFWW